VIEDARDGAIFAHLNPLLSSVCRHIALAMSIWSGFERITIGIRLAAEIFVLRVNLKFIFTLILFVTPLIQSALFAEGSDPRVLYCKDKESSDRLEPCEEIKILDRAGETIKAYGFSSKRWLSVKRTNVFEISAPQNRRLSIHQHVAVNGSLLSTASDAKSYQVCEVLGSEDKEVYRLRCEAGVTRKLHRDFLWNLDRLDYSKKYPAT
jgi:hypothetical protein